MKKVLLLLIIAALTIVTVPVNGQIVNIESARMQSDSTGWLGGGGLSLTARQATHSVFGFDAEAHLQYKTKSDKSLWLVLASAGFLRGGGERYFNNRFAHLRYNYKVNAWLRWEVFTQILNNVITQIHTRFLVGTGPRFKLLKTKYVRMYAATLAMYEREKDITVPIIYHNDIRSSSYFSFTITPRENIELISTTFYQPLYRDFSDYRILNQAKLKVKASKHFSLSVNWDYLYDSAPAGTAPRETYNLGMGLEADL